MRRHSRRTAGRRRPPCGSWCRSCSRNYWRTELAVGTELKLQELVPKLALVLHVVPQVELILLATEATTRRRIAIATADSAPPPLVLSLSLGQMAVTSLYLYEETNGVCVMDVTVMGGRGRGRGRKGWTIVNHRDPPASILRCAIEWLVKSSDVVSTFDLGRAPTSTPKLIAASIGRRRLKTTNRLPR
ncbi:hypothetical protein MUK42_06020 [Musa troglodytarum]|nr:hypothetical protein MUK42_06020 [Musa troglodytarum]